MRIWPVLSDERIHATLLIAERHADGLATAADLDAAREALPRVVGGSQVWSLAHYFLSAARWACQRAEVYNRQRRDHLPGEGFAAEAAEFARLAATSDGGERIGLGPRTMRGVINENKVQSNLLRCLFGPLPFRTIEIDPRWCSQTVKAVAAAIYAERRWGDLPILGDALTEASCTDADVLSHCGGPGPHARGCWLIDLLLNKE
jgi:hypothetical protein